MNAIDVYQRALEQDPRCAAALWALGWYYQVVGKLDEAVAAWDRLRALDPAYPELEKYYPILTMRRDQAAAIAALPDPGELPPPEEIPRPGPTLTLRGVGDVHLGRGWPEARAVLPPEDARELFSGVADLLADADVTFGYFETALKDDGLSS